MFRRIINIAAREVDQLVHTPIYLFCMVIFPIIILIFFTSLMSSGQPEKMPCGVVDNDNSAVTRTLIRRLDAFQSTKVVAHYTNVNEARRAIQQGTTRPTGPPTSHPSPDLDILLPSHRLDPRAEAIKRHPPSPARNSTTSDSSFMRTRGGPQLIPRGPPPRDQALFCSRYVTPSRDDSKNW
mgnify:CR=1 FL=1